MKIQNDFRKIGIDLFWLCQVLKIRLIWSQQDLRKIFGALLASDEWIVSTYSQCGKLVFTVECGTTFQWASYYHMNKTKHSSQLTWRARPHHSHGEIKEIEKAIQHSSCGG